MRTIASILAILATAPAFAQSRPSTTTMSCASATNLVIARGAIVLGTGGDTYERFVRDASFCFKGQVTRARFAPTSDNAQCMIGWRCFDQGGRSR